MQMQSPGQCEVAAVSQGGDDQAGGAAQVLIAILEVGVALKDLTVVCGLVPFVAQLSSL